MLNPFDDEAKGSPKRKRAIAGDRLVNFRPTARMALPPVGERNKMSLEEAAESEANSSAGSKRAHDDEESTPRKARRVISALEYMESQAEMQTPLRSQKVESIDEIFSPDVRQSPIVPSPASRYRTGKESRFENVTYELYGLSALPDLLERIITERGDCREARFIYTTDNELLFSFEGRPSQKHKIPAHYEMTGEAQNGAQCLSAGNISFEKRGTSFAITFINHKSGDFRPGFHSIVPVISLMTRYFRQNQTSIDWNGEIAIEELDNNGGTKRHFTLDRTCLDKLSLEVDDSVYEKNSLIGTKKVTYEANVERRRVNRVRFNAGSPTRTRPLGRLFPNNHGLFPPSPASAGSPEIQLGMAIQASPEGAVRHKPRKLRL